MRKEFSLENLHIIAVTATSIFLFFLLGKKIFLGFFGVSLVFHIYLRILKFSFSPFQGLLALKMLGTILRVILSSFLLFLLIKGAAISFLSVLFGLVIFLLSLVFFGYFQNFKFADNARKNR